jgi:hypothetical protein
MLLFCSSQPHRPKKASPNRGECPNCRSFRFGLLTIHRDSQQEGLGVLGEPKVKPNR